MIQVYMREPEVRVLGPFVRYGLWVQGCCRSCEGCTAADSQPMNGGTPMSSGVIAAEILRSDTEGVTISGGEPFLQAQALAEMIALVRAEKDIGVIIYTGFTYEELLERPDAMPLLAQTDLLIDGPYIQALDDEKSLRGSSNQRVIPLTERYQDKLHLYGSGEREAEFFRHGFELHNVGVMDHRKNT